MVGAVPIHLALRDTLLAAGLGFLLAATYRLLRLVAGSKTLLVALCDVLLCMAGAVFYRSAAMSVFAAGTMRWYTAASLLLCYALCTQMFYPPFYAVRTIICKPFLWLKLCFLQPFYQKIAQKKIKRREKKQKKPIKDLPNHVKMLYNSN
ncbi:MAG: hypothetical protein RR284_00380 [Ruthenibacterium sp.]